MLNLTRLCQIVQATWFTLESVWRDRREGPSTRGPLNSSIRVTHTCRKVDTWDWESSRSRQLTNTAFLPVLGLVVLDCCQTVVVLMLFVSILEVRRILSGGPLASGLILVMNLKNPPFSPPLISAWRTKFSRYRMQRLRGLWRRLSFNHQRRFACRQRSNRLAQPPPECNSQLTRATSFSLWWQEKGKYGPGLRCLTAAAAAAAVVGMLEPTLLNVENVPSWKPPWLSRLDPHPQENIFFFVLKIFGAFNSETMPPDTLRLLYHAFLFITIIQVSQTKVNGWFMETC